MWARLIGGQKGISKLGAMVGTACGASKQAIVVADFRNIFECPFLAFRDCGRGVMLFVNCFVPSITESEVQNMSRVLVGSLAFGLLRASSK